MIIVLAALQLTSNDVHSRLTKNSKIVRPPFRPGANFGASTAPLETMQFVDNQVVSVSVNPGTTVSSVSAETGSYGKDTKDGKQDLV